MFEPGFARWMEFRLNGRTNLVFRFSPLLGEGWGKVNYINYNHDKELFKSCFSKTLESQGFFFH